MNNFNWFIVGNCIDIQYEGRIGYYENVFKLLNKYIFVDFISRHL